VSPRGTLAIQATAGAQVLHADGKFILPGLSDAHTHYQWWMPELMLHYGVTTVYDIAGSGQWGIAQREAIAHGKVLGPRLFTMFQSLLDAWPGLRVVGVESPVTVEKAREVVRRACLRLGRRHDRLPDSAQRMDRALQGARPRRRGPPRAPRAEARCEHVHGLRRSRLGPSLAGGGGLESAQAMIGVAETALLVPVAAAEPLVRRAFTDMKKLESSLSL
jgi:hypothetical protein